MRDLCAFGTGCLRLHPCLFSPPFKISRIRGSSHSSFQRNCFSLFKRLTTKLPCFSVIHLISPLVVFLSLYLSFPLLVLQKRPFFNSGLYPRGRQGGMVLFSSHDSLPVGVPLAPVLAIHLPNPSFSVGPCPPPVSPWPICYWRFEW